jgi:hypothetical protein
MEKGALEKELVAKVKKGETERMRRCWETQRKRVLLNLRWSRFRPQGQQNRAQINSHRG